MNALAIELRPASGHALRALLVSAICSCVLALLCAALVNQGPAPSIWSPEEAGTALGATAAPVDAGTGTQADNDVTIRPEVGGISVRHALRKPRRSNRRLRVPGRARARSDLARVGARAIGTTHLTLKRKRTSKRAQMRRLMTVRGGLQA
jgi:hypothetical protein